MNLDDSINKAFEADRAAIPADDPASRARLIDMLGTLPPAAVTGAAPAGGIFPAGIAKIAAIGIATLGLGSAAWLLPGYFAQQDPAPVVRTASPAAAPAPIAAPVVPADPIMPPGPLSSREGEPERAAGLESEAEPGAEKAGGREGAAKSRVMPVAESERSAAPAADAGRAAVAHHDTTVKTEPVVITRDSMRVEVNVNMDGLR